MNTEERFEQIRKQGQLCSITAYSNPRTTGYMGYIKYPNGTIIFITLEGNLEPFLDPQVAAHGKGLLAAHPDPEPTQ